MTRPILYLSGPYSPGNGRTIAENIAVARAHAVAAARKGWFPFTPHLNTAGFEVDCPEIPHSAWLAGDLAILRLLARARAAVLLLPGWEQSKGARLERDWAIHLNLEVFDPPATPAAIPPAVAVFAGARYHCDLRDDGCSCDGESCVCWSSCPVRGRCR